MGTIRRYLRAITQGLIPPTAGTMTPEAYLAFVESQRVIGTNRPSQTADYATRSGVTIPATLSLIAVVRLAGVDTANGIRGVVAAYFAESSGPNRHGLALTVDVAENARTLAYAGGPGALASSGDVAATDILDGTTRYLLRGGRVAGGVVKIYARKLDGSARVRNDSGVVAGSIQSPGANFSLHTWQPQWTGSSREAEGAIEAVALSRDVTSAELDALGNDPDLLQYASDASFLEHILPDWDTQNHGNQLLVGSDFEAGGVTVGAGTARLTAGTAEYPATP